jgi:hypothetical protein
MRKHSPFSSGNFALTLFNVVRLKFVVEQERINSPHTYQIVVHFLSLAAIMSGPSFLPSLPPSFPPSIRSSLVGKQRFAPQSLQIGKRIKNARALQKQKASVCEFYR